MRFVRSFMVVRFVTPLGKINTALASPAGEPPFQLLSTVQRALVAPVQVWVAGARRLSSHSNSSRSRPVHRTCTLEEDAMRPVFRVANLCHQVPIILDLLSRESDC